MEGSSSKGKRKVTKVSESALKKYKGGEGAQRRKINQDMINQMSSPGAKSRRSKANLLVCDQLEDDFKEIGDVWTRIRGHELFLYHYSWRSKPTPISNPWITGLGKLVVPNIFVNVQLMKTLDRAYNATKICIQLSNGEAFIHLSVATIQEVFNLGLEFDVPLSFEKLEEEYTNMDTIYNGWNLAMQG